jgi:hypothetical protein
MPNGIGLTFLVLLIVCNWKVVYLSCYYSVLNTCAIFLHLTERRSGYLVLAEVLRRVISASQLSLLSEPVRLMNFVQQPQYLALFQQECLVSCKEFVNISAHYSTHFKRYRHQRLFLNTNFNIFLPPLIRLKRNFTNSSILFIYF